MKCKYECPKCNGVIIRKPHSNPEAERVLCECVNCGSKMANLGEHTVKSGRLTPCSFCFNFGTPLCGACPILLIKDTPYFVGMEGRR